MSTYGRNLLQKTSVSRVVTDYSVSDLLDQATIERLYDEVTNPKRKQKSAGLLHPDFKFDIPLGPPKGSSLEVLRVRPNSSKKKIFEALIWTALFGSKKFNMVHWYILYTYFEKTISKSEMSEALFKIIRLTTERSGRSFDQKLKPVKTIIQNVLGKEDAVKYCLKLAKDLRLNNLPKEDPKLSELLEVVYGHKHLRRPPEKRYIGIGYKDKGNLPKGPKEDTEFAEDYLVPASNLFAVLLERTSEVEIFINGYNPQNSSDKLKFKKIKSYIK
jgi:hypothetical protein